MIRKKRIPDMDFILAGSLTSDDGKRIIDDHYSTSAWFANKKVISVSYTHLRAHET